MRDALPEFFPPTIATERFITDASIVLDSNVLLSLYRWSPGTRDEAIAVLRAVADRLWFPHYVCQEYLTNRKDVAGALDAQYEKALKELSTVRQKVTGDFDSGKRHRTSREAVQNAVDRAVTQLEAEIRELWGNDDARIDPDDDHILSLIEELSDGRIGGRPPTDVVRRRLREYFDHREPLQIPPGYKDAGKRGLQAAGDYLIWCEILDHARTIEQPVLFVTDDGKEDWYEVRRGARTGPRRELVAEFAEYSTMGYHQMGFDKLIQHAKEHLNVTVHDEAVDEIVEASLETKTPRKRSIDPAFSATLGGRYTVSEYLSDMQRLSKSSSFRSALEQAARDSALSSRLGPTSVDEVPLVPFFTRQAYAELANELADLEDG